MTFMTFVDLVALIDGRPVAVAVNPDTVSAIIPATASYCFDSGRPGPSGGRVFDRAIVGVARLILVSGGRLDIVSDDADIRNPRDVDADTQVARLANLLDATERNQP